MPQGRAAASRLAATLAIGACVVLVPAASAGEAPGSGAPHVNRLAQSNSPYLLSHANQPVDWYPWGPEALAKAKRENKPIFLSVGYRTCYWCHVAARSIYAKPEFAREMSAPGGGFYTAQDAEVDGREGASYAWMKPEIDSACGARAPAFFDVYSLTPLPAPPVGETADLRLLGEDEGVIRVRLPIVETLRRASSATAVGLIESLRPARDRLLEVRNRRKQPLRDEKIVVAPNGLAIEAFAEAGRLLARRDLPVSGTMRATVTVQACDDQVCLPPSRMPVTAGMGN